MVSAKKNIIQGRIKSSNVWRTPSFIFAGFGIVTLLFSNLMGQKEDWFVLGFACIVPLIYSGFLVLHALRDGTKRVLTDPFLILTAAFSLFFLLGTSLLVVGPENQANYALSWYPTTARDAVFVTGMNLIGFAVMLFSASLFKANAIEKMAQPVVNSFSKISTPTIFWCFLLIGVGIELYVLSIDLFAEEAVVMGIVRKLSGLSSVAILTGTLYKGRKAWLLNNLAILFAIIESLIGFISFSKSGILLPLLVLILGIYLRGGNLKLLISNLIALFVGLLLIVYPISIARNALLLSDKSIDARINIMQYALSVDSDDSSGSGLWARFCYAAQQNAAVKFYQQGQGGTDVELLGWVFLPRALFPEKPIITQSAIDFNEKMTGFNKSASAMGVFVNGYYNLGWIGLFAVSILSGWILSFFAALSRAVVLSGSMVFLPITLLGNFIAFKIDGTFVGDYLGVFAQVMVPLLVLFFILRQSISKPMLRRIS